MRRGVFIAFLSVVITAQSAAQTCCSGGVPVSGNIGLFPLDKNGFQLSVFYDYNVLDRLKENSFTLSSSDRIRTTNSILLETSYSFSDRFSLYGLFSWVKQQRKINNGTYSSTNKTSGVGDVALMPGYVVVKQNYLSWLISAGIKLPTGKSNLTNSDGILLSPDLQPGSGAYDGLILSMIKLENLGRNSFWNQISYRNTGSNNDFRNNDSYRFGNELVISAGWSANYLLFGFVTEPAIILSYRNAGKDKLNQNSIPNTGGNWFFSTAGFSVYPINDLKVFISGSLPVYSEPQGIQLTTTFRLNIGMHLIINKKDKIIFN